MKKYFLLAIIAACLTSCGGNASKSYRTAQGTTWGTVYNITYNADCDLSDSIKAVMGQIDASLSMFNPSSTTSRINKGETDVADGDFIVVFNKAAEISKASGGAFDPTVGTLVNLWGFGNKGRETEIPDETMIAEAMKSVGMSDCRLTPDGKVKKKSPATEFDFNAIAKGYGCDRVAAMLERNGCSDYLVEIGGEISLKGKNSRGEEWCIQIDAPVESRDAVHEQMSTMTLTDCGVATSGNYRNYRDTDSGRVGHTISPVTGMPLTTSTLSATVVAPDAMTADAYATACMAMDPRDALTMIEKAQGVSALLVVASGDGYKILKTENFPDIK